ncbi:MAG: MaoC family dehydratase [Ktedonobacteraceae bacterium]|nr:MaoC family dehydratase [Ktedonobacteraceae bacterium]MBV9712712.1 MaoC family dehydratase [Ktedonobacteraceae bacterium]
MSQTIKKFAPLPALGAQATLSRVITEHDIVLFAEVSGDKNPLHLDAVYAERSLFGKRIAHGFLIGSLISAVLGNILPGPGSIYLGQTLKFLAPIHVGDEVTVLVKVVAVREEKRIVTLHTQCSNQHGTVVLSGEATIKYAQELEETLDA